MDLSFPRLLPPLTLNSQNFYGKSHQHLPTHRLFSPRVPVADSVQESWALPCTPIPEIPVNRASHHLQPFQHPPPRKIPAPCPPKGRWVSSGPTPPWMCTWKNHLHPDKTAPKTDFCSWPVLPLPCPGTGRCGMKRGARICFQPLAGTSCP